MFYIIVASVVFGILEIDSKLTKKAELKKAEKEGYEVTFTW